jgi:hypothetical protein
MGALCSEPSRTHASGDTFRSIAMEYDQFRVEDMDEEEEVFSVSTFTPAHEPPSTSMRTFTLGTALSPRAAAAQVRRDIDRFPNGVVLLIDDSPVAAKVASKVLSHLKFDVITV